MRLIVTNLDIGELRSFAITSADLGGTICSASAPVGPGASASCVVGPITADATPGQHSISLDIDSGKTWGVRQGESTNCLVLPQIDPGHPYEGGRFSFTFYFGACVAGQSDVVVEGASNDTSIDVGTTPGAALSGPLHVNCSDLFTGGYSEVPGGGPQPGDVPVAAFAITEFAADGTVVDQCGPLPVHGVSFGSTRHPLSIDYTST